MARYLLSDGARTKIEQQVDGLFDKLLGRFVGPGPKTMMFEITHDPILTLPGIFASATVEGGALSPNKALLSSLLRISTNYVNAIREKTKAKLLNDIESAISRTGTEGMAGVMNELEGQLASLWTTVTADIKRVVQTELSGASNQGLHDGILQVSEAMGINDPIIFFVPVRDGLLCDECKKLHLQPDGITPRVWKMSEVSMSYHVKGEDKPSVHELHPNGRCTMTTLLPGFGFNSIGLVAWVSVGHDEYKKQRGE